MSGDTSRKNRDSPTTCQTCNEVFLPGDEIVEWKGRRFHQRCRDARFWGDASDFVSVAPATPYRLDEGSKNTRGCASQYYVAAELSRRGVIAAITLGNCPNTDILCSDASGRRFAHVQVKTFPLGNTKCAVGMKAERNYGTQFFWVLVGLPTDHDEQSAPDYYIIPSEDMANHVKASFDIWVNKLGADDQPHDAKNTIRVVRVPPGKNRDGWKIDMYKNRWDFIVKYLQPANEESLMDVDE